MTNTVPNAGGAALAPVAPVVASHIDITGGDVAPTIYPEAWTPEIIAAFERGAVTFRRAERLAAVAR